MKPTDFFGPDSGIDRWPSFVAGVDERDGVVIYRLTGPLDESIAPEINSLGGKFGRDHWVFERNVLFDFALATTTNFTTISYLVASLARRTEKGKRIGYVNKSPELGGAVEIAKLDTMFKAYASEDEAIADLASS